jgi:hypothetical protein
MKHRLGKIDGGYNYRGYCVYREGRWWYYLYDDGAREYCRSLREFRSLADGWCLEEKREQKEQA